MKLYKVIHHGTGEVLAVRIQETEISYYTYRVDDLDTDSLPHSKRLEQKLNNETMTFPTAGTMTKIQALVEFGTVWTASKKEVL